MSDEIKCPKCGSTQVHADKRGFKTGRAIVGTLAGGLVVGAATGAAGSNKIKITCLKCGYSYYAGNYHKEVAKINAQKQEFTAGGFAIFSFLFSLFALLIWLIFDSTFFGITSILLACAFLISLVISLTN